MQDKPLKRFINTIGKHLESFKIAYIDIIENYDTHTGIVYFDKFNGVVLKVKSLKLDNKNLYNFIKNEKYDRIIVSFDKINLFYEVENFADEFTFKFNSNYGITVLKEDL